VADLTDSQCLKNLQDSQIIERNLEVKPPTIWRNEKVEVGRISEEKRRSKKIREEKRSEERRSRCAKR
jgi:hypothetical protein